MCGINIIVSPDAARMRGAIEAMNNRIAHRGPDGAGVSSFPRCLLGHRRLSIIDLSGGHQPMTGADGRHTVTFNGEIYGYKKLREMLDYPFRTHSDTEILLALYRDKGRSMMTGLPGMFAFAIWDEDEQALFAARDRMGEKPFYYSSLPGGGLVASSEIKAILASGLVNATIDRQSLAHYLQYGYSPAGRTIYREIHSLKPAHQLWLKDGRLDIRRYWDYPVPRSNISPDAAVEEFRHLFGCAVEKQLVADVEVAAFLSGGLDSSAVVAAATRHNASLQTIAYGFSEPYSELEYAQDVAEKFGTRHTVIRDEEQDLVPIIRQMPGVYDEPFWDSSAIPTWLICRRAAEHVKVVMTGDGGDEVLGGYNYWYKPIIAMHERYPRRTAYLDMMFLAARLVQKSGLRVPAIEQFTRLYGMRRRCGRVPMAHRWQQRVFAPKEYVKWGLEALPMSDGEHLPDEPGSMFRIDMEQYMPGDILVKTDRASMAHSLELRAPFLDVDLVEFCLSLPYDMVIRDNVDKYLLRAAMEESYPESVKRRGKKGFGAPLDVWMKKADPLVREYLGNPKAAIFDQLPSLSVADIGAMDHRRQWCLLMLSLWLEQVYRKEIR